MKDFQFGQYGQEITLLIFGKALILHRKSRMSILCAGRIIYL